MELISFHQQIWWLQIYWLSIGYDCFQKTIQHINTKYVSCMIQISVDSIWVSDSPCLYIFDGLEQIRHQVSTEICKELRYNFDTGGERQIGICVRTTQTLNCWGFLWVRNLYYRALNKTTLRRNWNESFTFNERLKIFC